MGPLIQDILEPVYRQAEKEWKDFVDVFTDLLVEVDSHIPHLPAKDVIHRIYRDVSTTARLHSGLSRHIDTF